MSLENRDGDGTGENNVVDEIGDLDGRGKSDGLRRIWKIVGVLCVHRLDEQTQSQKADCKRDDARLFSGSWSDCDGRRHSAASIWNDSPPG